MTEELKPFDIANAIEKCDWSGASIGNKYILRAAVAALRASAVAEPVEQLHRTIRYVLDKDEDLSQFAIDELTLALDLTGYDSDAHPAPAASVPSVDRCAKCGEPRKEHAYNGACYGACDEFVAEAPVPASVREAALEAAAIEFIAKVDRGEARSKSSYAAFKAALASLPAPEAAPTIDDAPSYGQENDYRRAKPAAAPTADERWCLANNISCTDPTMPEAAPTREEIIEQCAKVARGGYQDHTFYERGRHAAADAILALKSTPAI